MSKEVKRYSVSNTTKIIFKGLTEEIEQLWVKFKESNKSNEPKNYHFELGEDLIVLAFYQVLNNSHILEVYKGVKEEIIKEAIEFHGNITKLE